ncbi:hypothetical protein BDZ94DRAFT_736282 [Collybia nuda]|uniref:Uncharacterized protein n=1 Tax=Collybia nuda TaxID=64659 RepID=A0A9P5Y4X6_9AGAR|nr:hypothetical protein BDZ94DRAFT_736282 [Collybia nuda]
MKLRPLLYKPRPQSILHCLHIFHHPILSFQSDLLVYTFTFKFSSSLFKRLAPKNSNSIMDHRSYDGSLWDCLSSTGLDPGTEYSIFGDSGLDSLWPDDWTTPMTNENLFIPASSMVPQPSPSNIPPSNDLNSDFAGPSTSPKKSKAKGKQRKEKVNTGKVQTSPRREGFVEVQNVIPTTAPIPPASPISAVVEGATLNNENAHASEPPPSALVSALASEGVSKIHGATQSVPVAQSNIKASPRRRASKISAPQPEEIPDLSGDPIPNLSNEALEAILNHFKQNVEGFDTGPEAVAEVPVEAIAATAAPEIPKDPVAYVAEPISRKRKADEIVEDDIAGWFGDIDFATADFSEVEGLFENKEFAGGPELPSGVEISGDEGSTRDTASCEDAEASRNTQSASGVNSERVDPMETPEVGSGAEGTEASKENKVQNMYCDICDQHFNLRYSYAHYKRAAHNENRIKYDFIHGFVHDLITGKLHGYHGGKDRAPTINKYLDPELYKCGEPCAARRKLWEDHEKKTDRKKKAKHIAAELVQYHAPNPNILVPDISGLDPNLFLGQPISTLIGSAPPPPPPRPRKARRTAKKSNPVGAQVRTPQLPHGPQPTWIPAYQHVPGHTTREPTPAGAQEVHTPGLPQSSQSTWVPMHQHIPDRTTKVSTPVGAQARTPQLSQGLQLTWVPAYQHVPVPVATNNMGHFGELNRQSYPLMNVSGGFAYGSLSGVQSQNQNLLNSGPVAGPSSYTRPAPPSGTTGNAMRAPGPYMRHPQQQPDMYTMPMGQMNPPSNPNPTATAGMGNTYHNTGTYAPIMPLLNMQLPPAAPTMRNPYHYIPQYAAAAPVMTQPTFPTTDEYTIPSVPPTNQDYHEAGGWQAAPF